MSTTINLKNLSSRSVRAKLTKDSPKPGFRTISNAITTTGGNSGGFLQKVKTIFGKGLRLTGWIIGRVFSNSVGGFVGIFRAVVQVTSFIYNFNWNITDNQIDNKFQVLKQIVAGQLGETLGNVFGYLACGILPATAITVYNEPLGLYLLKEVGEEALDEFADNFVFLLQNSFRSLATAFAYSAFKNVRKAIKIHTSNPNSRTSQLIGRLFGNRLNKAIENWGEADSKPWSFRIAIEGRIDNIENPVTQEFVEEFYDEFKDSCVEAGYVIAHSLDTWVLQQHQQQRITQENESLVEILPNRENPDESIIVQGNNKEIKTQTMTAINTYNLVESRDVGEWVGEPLDDAVRKPHKEIAIRILLRGAVRPPFKTADGKNAKRTQIEIPNVKREKIKWRDIKQAVGSTNGYLWGRFAFNATLTDDNKIKFFAASEAEGRVVLDRLLKFTHGELSTLNIHEEKREGARKKYDKLYKQDTRVYPAYVVVINQLQILNQDEGKATKKGHKQHRQIKFPLYTNDEPLDFREIVNSLFLPVN